MRAFLQFLDEKVWQAVEIGWTKPTEAPADWDDAKIKAENFNSRALDALFNAVTNEEFKKISSTETTKEAWTIQIGGTRLNSSHCVTSRMPSSA